MVWDVNVVAGLVAGVAAMVPGAVIYDPRVLGKRWMQEIGTTPEKMRAEGARSPGQAVGLMFVTSLVNGLFASLLINTIGAVSVGEAVLIGLVIAWFFASANAMLVFFENRSWGWFWITSLNHVLTFALMGLVIGLFL